MPISRIKPQTQVLLLVLTKDMLIKNIRVIQSPTLSLFLFLRAISMIAHDYYYLYYRGGKGVRTVSSQHEVPELELSMCSLHVLLASSHRPKTCMLDKLVILNWI